MADWEKLEVWMRENNCNWTKVLAWAAAKLISEQDLEGVDRTRLDLKAFGYKISIRKFP